MTCETIDGVFKCVEELENQGSLRRTAENLIQTLKFELRYVRLHLKWHPYLDKNLLRDTETWVKDVQRCLPQVTRKEGSVRADFPEKTLSSLLVRVKKILSKQCSLYCEQEHGGLNINCKDVLIDELLLECIDPLLENMKLLMLCNDLYMLVSPTEQIEVLLEKLKSLRNIVEITGNELKELEIKNVASSQDQPQDTSDDLLTRIIRLVLSAVFASCYSWTEGKQKRTEKLFFNLRVEIDYIEPKIRMFCVQLLKASKISNPSIFGVDIKALAAADSLLDNLQGMLNGQDSSSSMPLEAYQIELLHQELSFIKYFLMDPNLKHYTDTESQSFNSLIIEFEDMASEGVSLMCSKCIGESKDHIWVSLMCFKLPKVVELIKAEIRKIYEGVLKPSVSGFPQTPMPGFLDFFSQRLDELLKHRAYSFAYVKKDLKIMQMNLEFLSIFVSKAREEDADIVKRVLDVAHEAERIIDLIAASSFPRWHYMFWLSDVIEKIIMLRKDCPEVCSKKSYGTCEFKVEKTSVRDSTQPYSLAVEEEVVGFEVEADKTIGLLTKNSQPLDIVSIVGMPGLGKTTLAKKVYEDPKIGRHFRVRSWYCISQVYDKRDLLLSILGDVTQVTEKIRKMDDEDMAQALCKCLRGKKYLIVIDDIWSIEAWKDMQNSFPDDFNGSRILFTSRIRQVALGVVPRSCDPVDLTLLSDDESWEFLRNKVFKHGTCPLKLNKIGKKIAKNCEGLPLSLVVIAGVLKRLEESEDQWEQVLVTLSKQVVGDSSKYTSVLELSYKHLPDHLKPCFLYLGAFPEDKEIQTWKLVRLWIAEGFVQKPHNHNQRLENVAEGYLVDLIRRSLVLISQNKSCGGVKSCRVHDLLREFSLNKAKDENFLLMSKEMMSPEQYRRCFSCKKDSLDGWMPRDPFVRSAIFFPTERPFTFFYDRYPIDPSVFPHIMKLLRVLDLERVPLNRSKFPTEIQVLVHLRYLAIQGRLMNRVPPSVGNLWRLETFVLKGTGGKATLPEALLKMVYLKHVYVDGRVTFELPPRYEPANEESIEAASIEKLSTALFRHGDGTTEEIIRRLTSLQRLKCVFSESSDDQLHALDLLSKLECLNATCHGHLGIQFPLSFPTNLVKLTLTNFRLPWSEISKIGELTQLNFLKLLSRAFEGGRWDVSEEEFLNLKFLKLESLDIVEWEVSPGAFPSLEQLVLQKCKRLEQVPPCFGELDTLKLIKVHSCSNSATKSACEIREEQEEDPGPDGLKVLVDWDSAPTS